MLLDTNVVMHYEYVDTIDWPTIVSAYHVLIVVHPELMRELNELKHGQGNLKKTRARAHKVIKHLDEIFSEGSTTRVRPNVDVSFEADEPEGEIFAGRRLNQQFSDDCHLASAVKLQQDHPNEEVLLITHDTGVQLKARHKGVPCMDAPSQHRLPETPASLEKRNQELQRELATFRARVPALTVCWDNDSERLNITKGAKSEENIQPDVRPALAYRTIRLDLKVTNNGQVPATDIDAILQMPQGLRVFDEQGMRSYWETPEDVDLEHIMERYLERESGRPGETVSQLAHRVLVDGMGYMIFESLVAPKRLQPGMLVSPPVRPKLQGRRIMFHIKKLKQGLPCLLVSICVVFDSPLDMRPFDIAFTVNAHEVPVNGEGCLSVVVEQEDNSDG